MARIVPRLQFWETLRPSRDHLATALLQGLREGRSKKESQWSAPCLLHIPPGTARQRKRDRTPSGQFAANAVRALPRAGQKERGRKLVRRFPCARCERYPAVWLSRRKPMTRCEGKE